MTQTVMRQAEGGSEAHPPIVVTIGAQNSQTYLNQGNEILQALYGQAPVRVDVCSSGEDLDIGEHYIYPDSGESKHKMLDDHPELSTNELNTLLSEGVWLKSQIVGRLRDKIIAKLPERYSGWENDVHIFIISNQMLDDGSQLLTALHAFNTFPNARCYEESHTRGTVPEFIQYRPLCMHCGKEMRPAGDAFVCESCGATAGGIGSSPKEDDALCPECSYPMEEVVGRRRLGSRTYHCNRCGHEIAT